MRKKIFGCLVVLAFGLMLSTGCAKKEIVKSEEPVPAQKPAVTAPPEVPPAPVPAPEVKPQPLPETPTRESTIPPEAAKPAAEQPTSDLQSQLQRIYFNFDSSDLSEDARNTLSKNADVLSKNSGVKIRVEGNCDERGSDEYNMALGERRAKAARDYLVNLGVPADRISIISYGEEKPVDPGHDEAAWAKNRRDDFVIAR